MIARHLNDNNRCLCQINIPDISHVHIKVIGVMPRKGEAHKSQQEKEHIITTPATRFVTNMGGKYRFISDFFMVYLSVTVCQ